MDHFAAPLAGKPHGTTIPFYIYTNQPYIALWLFFLYPIPSIYPLTIINLGVMVSFSRDRSWRILRQFYVCQWSLHNFLIGMQNNMGSGIKHE